MLLQIDEQEQSTQGVSMMSLLLIMAVINAVHAPSCNTAQSSARVQLDHGVCCAAHETGSGLVFRLPLRKVGICHSYDSAFSFCLSIILIIICILAFLVFFSCHDEQKISFGPKHPF